VIRNENSDAGILQGLLSATFIQAGEQNLLMTLWPISDKTTVPVMLNFYEAADRTHNASEALAEVQRDWQITSQPRTIP